MPSILHSMSSYLTFPTGQIRTTQKSQSSTSWRPSCSPGGEDMFWSHQDSITDPKATLNNHLWANNPPMDRLLFAYRHARGLCPLTKKVFLDWINTIAVSLGEDNLKGHRIWIGGTLEFLLWGMLWCLEISGPLDKWSFHTLPLPACDNYSTLYPKLSDSWRIHILYYAMH